MLRIRYLYQQAETSSDGDAGTSGGDGAGDEKKKLDEESLSRSKKLMNALGESARKFKLDDKTTQQIDAMAEGDYQALLKFVMENNSSSYAKGGIKLLANLAMVATAPVSYPARSVLKKIVEQLQENNQKKAAIDRQSAPDQPQPQPQPQQPAPAATAQTAQPQQPAPAATAQTPQPQPQQPAPAATAQTPQPQPQQPAPAATAQTPQPQPQQPAPLPPGSTAAQQGVTQTAQVSQQSSVSAIQQSTVNDRIATGRSTITDQNELKHAVDASGGTTEQQRALENENEQEEPNDDGVLLAQAMVAENQVRQLESNDENQEYASVQADINQNIDTKEETDDQKLDEIEVEARHAGNMAVMTEPKPSPNEIIGKDPGYQAQEDQQRQNNKGKNQDNDNDEESSMTHRT